MKKKRNRRQLENAQSYGVLALDIMFRNDKEVIFRFLNLMEFLMLFDEEEAEERALAIIGK